MAERLLSAAACAEIAERLAGAPASEADDARYLRACIPALLATVTALREALKPFIEERLRPMSNHCWSCDAILQDRPGHFTTHKADCPQQRAAAVYEATS